ncbi:MAG: hypothetical protein SLAVMIC_00395 [uncultured marine phage]|uniref:Uncharacterized protein n=1 Tax=uncultured marine phage TaxID=707152 RepID=A0A8D9C9Y8_9VIRU|nr:MAG: hypothetical protein SLAVMIC_00395 [uncultured marine phage]
MTDSDQRFKDDYNKLEEVSVSLNIMIPDSIMFRSQQRLGVIDNSNYVCYTVGYKGEAYLFRCEKLSGHLNDLYDEFSDAGQDILCSNNKLHLEYTSRVNNIECRKLTQEFIIEHGDHFCNYEHNVIFKPIFREKRLKKLLG